MIWLADPDTGRQADALPGETVDVDRQYAATHWQPGWRSGVSPAHPVRAVGSPCGPGDRVKHLVASLLWASCLMVGGSFAMAVTCAQRQWVVGAAVAAADGLALIGLTVVVYDLLLVVQEA